LFHTDNGSLDEMMPILSRTAKPGTPLSSSQLYHGRGPWLRGNPRAIQIYLRPQQELQSTDVESPFLNQVVNGLKPVPPRGDHFRSSPRGAGRASNPPASSGYIGLHSSGRARDVPISGRRLRRPSHQFSKRQAPHHQAARPLPTPLPRWTAGPRRPGLPSNTGLC